MKKILIIATILLGSIYAMGQSKDHNYGITAGGYIQQYNGNLGNSFFKLNALCFAGITTNFGLYLDKSLDFNVGATIGDFGYCQASSDANKVVSLSQRCPGCVDRLGMGELRSRMISGNIALKYKFANDIYFKADAKFAPYIYVGIGINHLIDNMKRNCVNVGNQVTLNGGAGIKYNITNRFNVSYNLAIGRFISDKVYVTNSNGSESLIKNDDDLKMEKRKDMYMQNSLSVGFNF